jgi:hypothetical protein
MGPIPRLLLMQVHNKQLWVTGQDYYNQQDDRAGSKEEDHIDDDDDKYQYLKGSMDCQFQRDNRFPLE